MRLRVSLGFSSVRHNLKYLSSIFLKVTLLLVLNNKWCLWDFHEKYVEIDIVNEYFNFSFFLLNFFIIQGIYLRITSLIELQQPYKR